METQTGLFNKEYNSDDRFQTHTLDNNCTSFDQVRHEVKSIKIGTLNVRGLRSKVGDVRDTITKEKLDILCITETMLRPAVADGELGIEGYFFVRQDRNSHGGGVAVYFRDSFPISRVQLRFDPENSDIVQNDTPEALFIELPGSQKRTILGCVYRPPSAPVASWSRLSDLVDSVISTHVSEKTELQLVLTGDFNVDVLDEEHPHFRHYQYFLASFNLLNYVHQPTRYGQTKRSCLDLLLTDEASLVHSCTPVPSIMETDHELVIADLLIAQPPSPPPVQPPYRNIKNINVSLFCNDLENQNLAKFPNGKNVDSMWLEWIEKFNQVLDRHAPLRSPQGSRRKVQRRTRCDCPWMTPELRLLIRQKLKAHRQLSKDPSNSSLREHSLFSDEIQQSYPEL